MIVEESRQNDRKAGCQHHVEQGILFSRCLDGFCLTHSIRKQTGRHVNRLEYDSASCLRWNKDSFNADPGFFSCDRHLWSRHDAHEEANHAIFRNSGLQFLWEERCKIYTCCRLRFVFLQHARRLLVSVIHITLGKTRYCWLGIVF